MARHRQVTGFGRDSCKRQPGLADAGLAAVDGAMRAITRAEAQTDAMRRCCCKARPEADGRREREREKKEEEGRSKTEEKARSFAAWCGLRRMSSEGLNVQIDR